MPWLGRPFVGVANYAEALADPRFWSALGPHGRVRRRDGRARARAAVCCWRSRSTACLAAAGSSARPCFCRGRFRPWSRPSSGASCSRARPASPTPCSRGSGVAAPTWFADALAAWVPLVLADVVEDDAVRCAAAAGRAAEHRSSRCTKRPTWTAPGRGGSSSTITLPLLRPALLVAFLFRTLDAFRVFDVVYVMTGGGPGTATEPIALTRSARCCRICVSATGRRCR